MKPCDCGATGAYDYVDASGDYSLCQECYDIAERQQQETEDNACPSGARAE